MVIKVDQRSLWRELGVTGREPRWAVAWKFPPITATTKLNRIVWNVGRTGRLLPFAMLEPVHVGGVTVSTATLHNEEDLARKDAREGDEVVVTRAGDVIPQVIAPLIQRRKGKRLRKPKPPAKCPRCDTPTVKPEDSVWTICPNRRGCPGQTFQLVKHFRGAMDIEGLGEKNAMRFLEEGLITDPASIYDLTAERIAELDGFGETSASALIREIERSKERPFGIVLYALGLPGIGYVNAQALAQHFGSIDALLAADAEQITEVDGIGPILAEQLRDELSDEAVLELIARLRERGLRFELSAAERQAEGGPLEGKTFVLTGTLTALSREEATSMIRRAGGKVTGSVSKNTDYVVAGESPGTKLAKAEELGTAVLDEKGPPQAGLRLGVTGQVGQSTPELWSIGSAWGNQVTTVRGVRQIGSVLWARFPTCPVSGRQRRASPPIPRDQRRHPVLSAVRGGDVDRVHQDREGDQTVPRLAVAGEGADADQGAGLGSAAALGGGPVHPVGDSSFASGPGQRVAKGAPIRLAVHRRQETADIAGGGAIRAGQPGAVLQPHPASQLAREPLGLAGAPRGRALRSAASREALEEHLGEEVVRGLVRFGDQVRHLGRANLAEGLAAKGAPGQVGAARPLLDTYPELPQPALQRLCRDQLGVGRVVAARDARVVGEA